MKSLIHINIKQLIFTILIISPFGFTNLSIADSLPQNYPDSFTWFGTIENINSATGNMIISDNVLKYNPATSVILLNSSNSRISEIKVGMTVGVIAESKNIVSLWELPNSFAGRSGTDIEDD